MTAPARRARSLVAGGAAALVVGLTAAPGSAAGAPAEGTAPATAMPATATPVAGALALRGHTYAVAPGEQLAVQITLGRDTAGGARLLTDTDTAGGAGAPPTEHLTISVHAAVTTLAELDAAFEDDGGAVLQVLDVAPGHVVATTTRDDVVDVDLAIPVDAPADPADPADPGAALTLAEPGIHPITVAAGDEQLRSVIRVVDRAAPPVAISAAVLLGVADPGPFPSAVATTAARADVRRLVELSAQVNGPLSLVLPPAAARLYEATTPAGAPPLATGLADDMLLARTANGIDPSAAIHRGAGELFSTDLRDGDDQLAQLAPLASTRRTVWYVDGDISRPAAGFLRLVGVRMLLFGPGRAPDPTRPGAPFGVDLGEDQRMVAISATPFDAAGRLLPDAAGSPNPELSNPEPDEAGSPVAAAARLTAGVELHAGEQQTGAVVLTPAGDTPPDARLLALFAGNAQRSGTVALAGVAVVANVAEREADGDDHPVMELPEVAGTDLGLRLWAAGIVQPRVDQARSMLVDPGPGADWDDRITATMSALATDAEAEAALAAVRSEADAIIGALVPPEPVPFTLTGTDTLLHFTVGNRADVDLRAFVRVRSPKLEPRSAPEERIVPAGGTETFDVSVKARSNGTFSVVVDVYSPDGQRVVSSPNIKASVTRLGGLGQLVSGSLALVLASWWYSHFRRRARNAAARDAAAGIPAEPAERGS